MARITKQGDVKMMPSRSSVRIAKPRSRGRTLPLPLLLAAILALVLVPRVSQSMEPRITDLDSLVPFAGRVAKGSIAYQINNAGDMVVQACCWGAAQNESRLFLFSNGQMTQLFSTGNDGDIWAGWV